MGRLIPRTPVDMALYFHAIETGHEVQFKEEWVYDEAVREPQLHPEYHYKVILRGSTRFERAHAIIEYTDGRRYIQTLGPILPKNITDEHLQAWTYDHAIGKARPFRG